MPTIDKAIKDLTELNENYSSQLWPEPNEAIKLGIEALKFFKEERDYMEHINPKLLPGETKD